MASSTELSTTSQTRWCSPRETGGADVHARPLADRLEAFEDLDVLGVVGRRGGGGVGVRLLPGWQCQSVSERRSLVIRCRRTLVLDTAGCLAVCPEGARWWGEQRGRPTLDLPVEPAPTLHREAISLPAGCHEREPGPSDAGRRGRSGGSSDPDLDRVRSGRLPTSASRAVDRRRSRNRTWVAQAGSSTSTSSTPSSRRTGRRVRATVGPTASSQRPKTPPIWMRSVPRQRLHDRVERPRDRNGLGHGPQRTRSLGGVTCPPITAQHVVRPRAAEAVRSAVVITIWPAGR